MNRPYRAAKDAPFLACDIIAASRPDSGGECEALAELAFGRAERPSFLKNSADKF
ncbi:hypothetical protein [Treponema endosymbiont of Eucomonympha sp.]|uniref:hypothetical protein n=1 Tax=Treponema endosymbiont of Eucomonympha sp. TaxID=1580831 RepID=UPI000A6B2A94|nr:hypothetical protein [Treponema endosymbiont of Eucomonympha sp.]